MCTTADKAVGEAGGWDPMRRRLWAARHDPTSPEPVTKEIYLLARSWFQRLASGGVPPPNSAAWEGAEMPGIVLCWQGRLQKLSMLALLSGPVEMVVLDEMSGVAVHRELHMSGTGGRLRAVLRSPPAAPARERRTKKPTWLARWFGGRK